MHHRSISRAVAIAAAALLSTTIGCGGNNDDVTGPAPPTSVTVPFGPDTLTHNGAKTFSFSVKVSGGISAQLVDWEPNTMLPVGMSLGTWNGSVCQVVLDLPAAVQGSAIDGSTNTPGDFCVRIYDAFGNIVDPQTFVIHVAYFQPAQ